MSLNLCKFLKRAHSIRKVFLLFLMLNQDNDIIRIYKVIVNILYEHCYCTLKYVWLVDLVNYS